MTNRTKSSVQTPSTKEDAAEKTEDTMSYFLMPTKHDIFPLSIMVLSIALGLTAALLSFFVLARQDRFTAESALGDAASEAINGFNTVFASTVHEVERMAAFF